MSLAIRSTNLVGRILIALIVWLSLLHLDETNSAIRCKVDRLTRDLNHWDLSSEGPDGCFLKSVIGPTQIHFVATAGPQS